MDQEMPEGRRLPCGRTSPTSLGPCSIGQSDLLVHDPSKYSKFTPYLMNSRISYVVLDRKPEWK